MKRIITQLRHFLTRVWYLKPDRKGKQQGTSFSISTSKIINLPCWFCGFFRCSFWGTPWTETRSSRGKYVNIYTNHQKILLSHCESRNFIHSKEEWLIVGFLLVCLEYRLQISNYFPIIFFTFKFREKLKLQNVFWWPNYFTWILDVPTVQATSPRVNLLALGNFFHFSGFGFFFFLQILVEVKVITQTLIIECLWVGRDRGLPTEWIYG